MVSRNGFGTDEMSGGPEVLIDRAERYARKNAV
jgi:hypothetical protein